MLEEILRASYGLLLLKRGPQDMPAGDSVTMGLAVVYFASSFLLLALQGAGVGMAFLQAAVDLAILVGFVWLVLRQRGFPARLGQTLSALLVAGLVFGLLAVPSMHNLAPYMKTVSHGGQPPAPSGGVIASYLLLLVTVIWSLAVTVHILRHALEIRAMYAFGLTILYQVCSLLIMMLLFGGGAAH